MLVLCGGLAEIRPNRITCTSSTNSLVSGNWVLLWHDERCWRRAGGSGTMQLVPAWAMGASVRAHCRRMGAHGGAWGHLYVRMGVHGGICTCASPAHHRDVKRVEGPQLAQVLLQLLLAVQLLEHVQLGEHDECALQLRVVPLGDLSGRRPSMARCRDGLAPVLGTVFCFATSLLPAIRPSHSSSRCTTMP